ncbi:ESPR-type extended signal peptide-containing protein, partial [Megasphaera elsdenii]|uniref:ESPR-type extended signal peptide-containing protein n=1 Tax=Megasphaera elsdenii TaxID=907 RepID=UPI003399AB66
MNKIFKVIWSKSRNCYVVASELAKGTSKSTSTGRMAKRAALAAVAALLLFPAGIGTGFAAYSINTTTVTNTSGTKTSVITGDADDAKAISGAIMRSVNNATDIGELQDAMQSVETELDKHKNIINNLGTDKLTLSSDNTLQKESYDSTTKTTTTTNATGLKVAGPISAESGKITNSLEVGHNANVGGAVNAGSVNSRGNLNVNGNALVKGTLTSQSTINGNEIVSQTNITAKNKVVGMQGVVDNTLTSGNYVTAGNTVGENIVALDTQVKANADAINEEAKKRKYSVTNLEKADAAEAATREAKDNELNERITNEANAIHETTNQLQSDLNTETADRKTADNELNERITNEANAIHETTNKLQSDLTTETADRKTADNELNERITNEANA